MTDELSALARAAPTAVKRPSYSDHENTYQRTSPSTPPTTQLGYSEEGKPQTKRPTSIRDAMLGGQSRSERHSKPRTPKGTRPRIDRQSLMRRALGTSTLATEDHASIFNDRIRLVQPFQGAAGTVKRYQRRSRTFKPGSRAAGRRRGSATIEASEQSSSSNEPTAKPQDARRAARIAVLETLTRKFVSGHYDGSDVLGGKEKYKQSTMNEVARAMTLNPTYAGTDTTRFLNKVRSLLPAVMKPQSNKTSAPAT